MLKSGLSIIIKIISAVSGVMAGQVIINPCNLTTLTIELPIRLRRGIYREMLRFLFIFLQASPYVLVQLFTFSPKIILKCKMEHIHHGNVCFDECCATS